MFGKGAHSIMDTYTRPDWSHSALLTIDVQRDFTLPEAACCIPGTVDAIPAMQQLTRAYRSADKPIIHIVRLYLADGSNVDLCRREQVEKGLVMCAPGSEAAEIVPELLPSPSIRLDTKTLLEGKAQQIGEREWIVFKPRWGAFYRTCLEDLLKMLGVTTLVFSGCNFPNCPRTSIYEASERDFRIVLTKDAVSGVYDRGLEELARIAVHIVVADEVIRAVEGS
jgi:nicotinamidase-related amidase